MTRYDQKDRLSKQVFFCNDDNWRLIDFCKLKTCFSNQHNNCNREIDKILYSENNKVKLKSF
jgi:hypothetical protein